MTDPRDIESRTRAWQDAGIIDDAQRARIVEFELGAAPQAIGARERMQALFGVLGTLLVGLGVLLTVITNWDSIGDLLKLGMLVTTLVVAHGAALVADARSLPRWIGTIGHVVGMLVFFGGLYVVGFLYNVQAHAPLALLLVAVTGTAIALLADRMAVGWIAAVGWLGWGFQEVVESLDELHDEAMLAPMFESVLLGGITAVALAWALAGQARRDGEAGTVGLRSLVARGDCIAVPLRTLAMAGVGFMLTVATFAWHLSARDLDAAFDQPAPWIAAVVSLAAIAACATRAPFVHRRSFAVALSGVALGVVLLASWPHDVVIAVAASVVLGAGGAGLVLLGLVESRSELFGWGIAWLVVLVATRYADFMASVDLGGPGFIGAGLLLIAMAVLVGRSRSLWRRRGEVLR